MIAILWILAVILGVGATVWKGYVMTILWSWFLIPAFGFPILSIPVAIGITMVIALCVAVPSKKSETDPGKLAGMVVAYGYLVPLFSLGIGWIVKQFM